MGCRNDRRGRPDPVLNSLLRPAGSQPGPEHGCRLRSPLWARGGPETAEPVAPGEGVSGGRGAVPLPVRAASRRLSRTPLSPDPTPASQCSATSQAPCNPGFCSLGRPAAAAARPRGACGCSCGRCSGADPAATRGARTSGCCTQGRGPTKVTPDAPPPCSPRGAPAPPSLRLHWLQAPGAWRLRV